MAKTLFCVVVLIEKLIKNKMLHIEMDLCELFFLSKDLKKLTFEKRNFHLSKQNFISFSLNVCL